MTFVRREVMGLGAYRYKRPPHRIKLDQNESPYDLPPTVKRGLLERLGKVCWNRYPEAYSDTLAGKVAGSVRWKKEGVLLANGSNVLTQAIITATAVRGKILIPDPTFALYEIYGRALENRIIKVSLRDDFSFDAASFLVAIRRHRPGLVFLANPNAPTGTLIPSKDLKAIVMTARCPVVIDEAYFPFSGETLVSSLKSTPNLLILRTFSKAFSIAGVRVGYLLGSPEIVREVRKIVPPFCLNSLSAAIAEALLRPTGLRWTRKVVREISGERERVFQALSTIPGITPYPSAANFILFRAKGSKKIFRGLLDAGILIRDVSDNGRLKDCLRVTIGAPAENVRFLRTLISCFRIDGSCHFGHPPSCDLHSQPPSPYPLPRGEGGWGEGGPSCHPSILR